MVGIKPLINWIVSFDLLKVCGGWELAANFIEEQIEVHFQCAVASPTGQSAYIEV